jgi:chromosome segregation ATPase
MEILILILGIIEAGAVGFLIFTRAKGMNSGNIAAHANATDELQQKKELFERASTLRAELLDPSQLKEQAKAYLIARESLKAERGRVIITQAELETIEVRLRELDEIARELDASMTETKEEMKILKRKEGELASKNESLRGQISDSTTKMDAIIFEIELSAQMQEQVVSLKAELAQADVQIENLMGEIQKGNDQYFVLKKRYDALDIEYAQLYEKFAEQQG